MSKIQQIVITLCVVLIALPVKAQWITLDTPTEATARHENGLVSTQAHLYLMGGRGIKPIEQYNITDNKWIQRGKTPIEMHHITPVYLNGLIWVVTGLTGKYPTESPLESVYVYDPEKDQWREHSPIPKARQRGGAGVTIYNSKIYIVGGIKNGHTNGTTNMADEFDPATGKWRELVDAPHIRDHGNLVAVDNKLVVLGGRNSSVHEYKNFTAFFKTVVNAIDVLDMETEKWVTLSMPLPAPSAGGGAVSVGSTIYYMGGETEHLPALRTLYSLNIDTQKWMQHQPMNTGRHGTNAVIAKGAIYIAAGSGNRGGRPELNSIEKFELKQN